METELQRLEFPQYSRGSSILINSPNNSSTNVSIRADDDFRYTSLKDIISSSTSSTTIVDYSYNSPTVASVFSSRRHSSAFALNNDFSSSTISIKNHLVKHAASVYLQSAAVLAERDQSWFTRLWRRHSSRRIRQRGAAVGSSISARWEECVRRPMEVCLGFLRRVMSCIATQIVLIRSRTTSIAFN